jgi:2-methylcitrate dehydratase PrpD
MTVETPDVTRALVEHARAIRYEDVPPEALEAARHCLLDFLGCALAGSSEELCGVLIEQLVLPEGASQSSLIGRRERATAQTAALFNGSAGHALDYDDTHIAMGGHPSVPVLPALLALAEARGADGRDFITALVAGIELEARLGRVVGNDHYAAGFHTTGTVGTFGAAAACAHLLQLDEAGWLNALGLAGTQAAGLKSGFGTMAKPLHAGRAASAGLLSALLAQGGFTANPAVVEAAQGFAVTHSGAEPTTDAIERAAGRWYVCDTLFKYHAACYLTHAPIEAVAELRRTQELDPEKISSIEIQVNPTLFGVCNIQEPKTGLEGKFSLRATAALALLGLDTEAPETFCEDTITDPHVVSVRNRVRVVAAEGHAATQARVLIETPSGTVEAWADTGVPATDLTEQGARLRAKFERLAVPVLGGEPAAELADAIVSIEALASTAQLLALARPAQA